MKLLILRPRHTGYRYLCNMHREVSYGAGLASFKYRYGLLDFEFPWWMQPETPIRDPRRLLERTTL